MPAVGRGSHADPSAEPADRQVGASQQASTPPSPDQPPISDEQIVETCLRAAKHLHQRQRRQIDPFYVARQQWQWSREHWDQAHWDYQCRQRERWYGSAEVR